MKLEKFITYLLHPVLFSTISTLLYFEIQPRSLPSAFKYKILLVVFLSTYIIPVLFLFILKQRKRIEDFHLRTIQERKLPIIFFFAVTLLLAFRLLEVKVVNLLAFSFIGASLAMMLVFVGFLFKLKISLHTLAIGSLLGFIILISIHFQIRLLWLIIVLFLLFGLIAYSRLKLKAHTSTEVYLGFVVGVVSQFLVYFIFPFFYKI